MDTITTAEPPLVHDGSHAELPAGGVSPLNPPGTPVTPLDLIEVTNVRTKLRLYAILSALYVTQPDRFTLIPAG
jgi:hypothetical protein